MNWLIENLSTIIVSTLLIIAVLIALRSIKSDKANGKLSCGGNCGGCEVSCHSSASDLVDRYHHDHVRKC